MTRILWWFAVTAVVLISCGAGDPKDGWREEWVTVYITHYCPGPCKICGTTGVTSTGKNARRTRGCATDPKVIPTGSRLDIPGFDPWMPADDVGGAIEGFHVDVRVPDHLQAKQMGERWDRVRVWRKD